MHLRKCVPVPFPEIRGFFAASLDFPQRHYVIPVTDISPKFFYGGPRPRSVPVIRGGEGDSPGIEGPSVNSILHNNSVIQFKDNL